MDQNVEHAAEKKQNEEAQDAEEEEESDESESSDSSHSSDSSDSESHAPTPNQDASDHESDEWEADPVPAIERVPSIIGRMAALARKAATRCT